MLVLIIARTFSLTSTLMSMDMFVCMTDPAMTCWKTRETCNIQSFRFRNGCIRKQDVNKIIIQNGGNDGWKISSIMTVLRVGNYYTVLTADMGINRWIDGDSNPHQITLTKVA